MKRKTGNGVYVWMKAKLVIVVGFAMAAGAASHHQYVLSRTDIATMAPVHIYHGTVPQEKETEEAVDFDVEHLEVVELTPEEIEEEVYMDELELLAACVEAEAANQGLQGKRMVADVILNRVDSPDWPDTIEGVITQENQFATYANGAIERVTISEETFQACRMELGERGYPGIYYFTAGGYGEYGTPWRKVGDHYFCTE